MKYLLYLLWTIYLIWWIAFFNLLFTWEKNNINIEQIKDSIVIIIPEEKLISYKDNPKWVIEKSKSYWMWAWILTNSNWTIITANHVIENDKIDYILLHNNIEYEFEILSRNIEKDLATIKILTKENLKFNYLKIWKNIDIWEQVISFWVDTINTKIIYNTWTLISKKNKLENISNLLEISNTLSPWFSWWPIVNKVWELIGINYAISEGKNYWIYLK
jgi:S1-C subfamily serine protease